MKYLKYEKTLHEISDDQSSQIIRRIETGKKIIINGDMLSPIKCEIISDLPHNQDDYLIKPIKRDMLPEPEYEIFHRSKDHQERVNNLLKEIREDLSEKLSWAK